jgi:hypothetical protein
MSTRPLALFAVLASLPLQFAAAQTPTVSASVTGYTAIGAGPIPESEWVPIAVSRNDGVLHRKPAAKAAAPL